jgi:hypothetical protein
VSAGTEINLGRLQRTALLVGAALLVICAVYGLFRPTAFFRAYLVAFLFLLGLPLGSAALLMVQHLTGGMWGTVLRPMLEAGMRTLPLLVLFFLPVLLRLHFLYPWMYPDAEELVHDAAMQQKIASYLNAPFFMLRAAVYFAIWFVVAFFLNRWSVEQDRERSPELPRRFRLLSGPGLGLYGLAITFASIDWFMSLEPKWYSSIYAVIAVGMLLTAFAFAVLVTAWLADRPPVAEYATPLVLNDLGNLMLAFTMLWAYVSFSQFLLIWAGNLPEEISWFKDRFDAGWGWLAMALVLFQFVVPFVLLLSKDVKQNPRSLAATALLVLVLRLIDALWTVGPVSTEYPSVRVLSDVAWWDQWLMVALPVGLGGLWLGVFLWQLQKRPLVFVRELVLEEGLAHE